MRVPKRLTLASLAVLASVMAVFCAAALGDTDAGYTVKENGCGGSCTLKGVTSDIQVPSSMSVPSGSEADEGVSGASKLGSSVAFAESGYLVMNNATDFACNSTNDTGGEIRGFAIGYDTTGAKQCYMYGTPAGETHNRRVQRQTDSTCKSEYTPYCVSVWGDGVYEISIDLFQTVMDDGIQAGAGVSGSTGSGTSVSGTYPGSGTQPWARTSDIHSPGASDTTWTTISSALCDSYDNDWYVGTISGGFRIDYDTGTGCQ